MPEPADPKAPSPASEAGGPPRWALAAAAAVITLLQMGPEWPGRYRLGNDESYQLEAGVRAD